MPRNLNQVNFSKNCSLYKIAIPCSSDSYEEINLMCTRKELSRPFQNRLVSRIPLMVIIKNPLNKTNWVLFHLRVIKSGNWLEGVMGWVLNMNSDEDSHFTAS